MPKCDQCGEDMVWQGSMIDGGLKCTNPHLPIAGHVTTPDEAYIRSLKNTITTHLDGDFAAPQACYPDNFLIERALQTHSSHGNSYLFRLCCDACNYTGHWGSHDLTKDIGMVEICPDCGKKGLIHV